MPENAALLMIVLVLLGIFLIPYIFYLITLQDTLKAISPENRKMPPANVWLLFIPLFNLIWIFIVVGNIADSISAEASVKDIQLYEPRPGYGIGMAMAICHCASIIPVLGSLAALGGLVCWIIYWVKISGYKNRIINASLYIIEGTGSTSNMV